MFLTFSYKKTKKKKKKSKRRNKEIQSRRISTPSNTRSISLDSSSKKSQKPKNQKKPNLKINPNNPWAKFYSGMKVTDEDVKFDISTQKEVKEVKVHDPLNWDALEFKDKKVKIRGNQKFGYGSKKRNKRRK